ncbi:3-hydroxyacyl-CoA dehydrogenase/enoyl-CoA hydratase family protein [Caldalkalibacillus salinus]|uniref:3-hydroxyacyl-CoA dehydrogenase/enoyl-CoA hydratase family protein n=1 Tax=Caldalkalibacillus salinus TaxID=2803787 RepID=UPI0019228A1B|nr:3-hydroxyacyl-CoA dehydrogenase/enoyl-CoA hydratase family protein [Caldalkalibacillus salinus]
MAERQIKKAAVIGSGVMGAAIAAHLANAGIPSLLLDIVPQTLTPNEEKKGETLQSPHVRNRLATQAIAKLRKTKPAPLFEPSLVSHITPGNIEDHLSSLQDVDWIIEVVVERLDIKQTLLAKIESVWRPGTIVSTNTSGISIHDMVEGRSEAFQQHFLGTHFFNPPRYMKLLEIIPHAKTNPELISFMHQFCQKKLGKGVVTAKDTPNFIANRIGTYGLMTALQELQNGYTVDEIDAVSGRVMGRPKSATFRTLDMVGIDTFVHVANNVHRNVEDKKEKEVFTLPNFLQNMVEQGHIGEKSGKGFYQKVKTEKGSEIKTLHIEDLTYHPRQKIKAPSIEAVKQVKGVGPKLKAFLEQGDRYAELAWRLLSQVLVYAAEKRGEIADDITQIDQAMKWGFNWDLGPFEVWDAIGLEASVERMTQDGLSVPDWVKEWIAQGHQTFYQKEDGHIFYIAQEGLKKLEKDPHKLSLQDFKEQNQVIKSNAGASLIDIGDDVACLEFHSPNNAIGTDILLMIQNSMEEVRKNYRGLVIANEGRNFCVGANIMQLLMEAQNEEWEEVDFMIRQFQQTLFRLKYFEKPVVAAPHQMTLGGGVEVCMATDQVSAASETYYGLVEVGVGLIPGGGGCKETALRTSQWAKNHKEADPQPLLNHFFETIGMAKVATSASEAKRLHLLQTDDDVVMNRDYLVHEAKQAALQMTAEGYTPPPKEKIKVLGENGKAVLQLAIYTMYQGGYISDHDKKIANKLAHVLAGGNVPARSEVSEQYLLDLEREAFLSLCGEPKTQQRIQHMLTKGKPLRN